jgi:hypothetical protein
MGSVGGFDSISSGNPTLPLSEYISYDEMCVGALIGVSCPTRFINSGEKPCNQLCCFGAEKCCKNNRISRQSSSSGIGRWSFLLLLPFLFSLFQKGALKKVE